MRLTLLCTLVLLAGFWCTNALLYFRSMDLHAASVVEYYRGSEEEFRMPRTYGAMLEVTHMHLAMMAMVVLLLTHLAIFLPWRQRWRVAVVLGSFGSALLGEASGWLVRFVHPGFAVLKIAAFLGLQVGLAILLLGLSLFLLKRTSQPQAWMQQPTQPLPAGPTRPRGEASALRGDGDEEPAPPPQIGGEAGR
jgi:hypothetical protein